MKTTVQLKRLHTSKTTAVTPTFTPNDHHESANAASPGFKPSAPAAHDTPEGPAASPSLTAPQRSKNEQGTLLRQAQGIGSDFHQSRSAKDVNVQLESAQTRGVVQGDDDRDRVVETLPKRHTDRRPVAKTRHVATENRRGPNRAMWRPDRQSISEINQGSRHHIPQQHPHLISGRGETAAAHVRPRTTLEEMIKRDKYPTAYPVEQAPLQPALFAPVGDDSATNPTPMARALGGAQAIAGNMRELIKDDIGVFAGWLSGRVGRAIGASTGDGVHTGVPDFMSAHANQLPAPSYVVGGGGGTIPGDATVMRDALDFAPQLRANPATSAPATAGALDHEHSPAVPLETSSQQVSTTFPQGGYTLSQRREPDPEPKVHLDAVAAAQKWFNTTSAWAQHSPAVPAGQIARSMEHREGRAVTVDEFQKQVSPLAKLPAEIARLAKQVDMDVFNRNLPERAGNSQPQSRATSAVVRDPRTLNYDDTSRPTAAMGPSFGGGGGTITTPASMENDKASIAEVARAVLARTVGPALGAATAPAEGQHLAVEEYAESTVPSRLGNQGGVTSRQEQRLGQKHEPSTLDRVLGEMQALLPVMQHGGAAAHATGGGSSSRRAHDHGFKAPGVGARGTTSGTQAVAHGASQLTVGNHGYRRFDAKVPMPGRQTNAALGVQDGFERESRVASKVSLRDEPLNPSDAMFSRGHQTPIPGTTPRSEEAVGQQVSVRS